ncbi:MAG: flavodoxin family protein [Bacillota bacterium]|nr:flavodoxin family protein [Bacillota bacterium]
MKKKYFAIMASHRKNKNTDSALNKYINKLEDNGALVEKANLLDFNISICTSCYYCSRNYKECVIKDDMEFFYKKFEEYDNFIFATPVFFNNLSTLGKIMVDRSQMVYAANTFFEKRFKSTHKKGKAVIISTAGAPYYDDQFTGVESTLRLFFRNLNAEVVEHIKISDTDKNL